ncbi:ISAs1 family transposase [Streptomyces sp. RKAG293]|uniref:ISAs1 family transposase n=1 Tax=Streptomyces sp. RKAG293 TaxID=2893403 RepID=UPI002033C782|nr:ISAs1 family transposase [Streptomyces sp. RKAG293]MCM2416523.1 ISAs1 family transposase [Streptomyces sp. RKAG293]
MTGDGRTVTQLRVPDKTNEITCSAALLESFDLTGVTITADALHTQRGHVRFLVEEKKAHYLFVVKANQPELHRRLRSLPWKDVTSRRYDRETGHGRRETRATRALTITDLGLDFPHAAQAVRILRHRTDLTTGKASRETVYAVGDLTSHQASPQRLGRLARSQWTIEDRFHFVRDTTFREDAPKIRTGHARTWQTCATWRSSSSAQPGTRTSPPASDMPPTNRSPARLTSWASPDQPTHKIIRLCNPLPAGPEPEPVAATTAALPRASPPKTRDLSHPLPRSQPGPAGFMLRCRGSSRMRRPHIGSRGR